MLTSPFPQSWRELVYLLIGTLITLIPQLVSSYRNRKKSDLENEETEARAALAQAEARSLQVRDDIATSEGVRHMLSTMIETGDKLREQQQRIFELERDQIALTMKREEVKRMLAFLHMKGYSYADVEKMREEK